MILLYAEEFYWLAMSHTCDFHAKLLNQPKIDSDPLPGHIGETTCNASLAVMSRFI